MTEKQELPMKTFRFSLRLLLGVFAGLGIALLLLVILKEKLSRSSLETRIVGGLMQVSPALKNYVDSGENRLMPLPAFLDQNANPLSSWRLKLIGRVTSPPTDYDLALPWDVSKNQVLSTWPCWVYCFTNENGVRGSETNLFAITGKGTAFNPERSVAISDIDSDVIVVMEVAQSGINWMEPGDYQLENLLECNNKLSDCIKTLIEDQVHVLFADGEIWCLSGETPMGKIKPFFTLDGAQKNSRDSQLEQYCLKKWNTAGISSP